MHGEQLPDDIPYERWVKHVFDHPLGPNSWWWRDDAEHWNEEASPARTLDYLTRLFAGAGELKDAYSPQQIEEGLNYIVSSACSSHMFAITDDSLPMRDRVDCVMAMEPLFRDLMAPLYDNWTTEGHEPYLCYMWWDVAPLHKGNCAPPVCQAVLKVLDRTLRMGSHACAESALHGLGHWHMYFPSEVRAIIDKFLEKETPLREYALQARKGNVV